MTVPNIGAARTARGAAQTPRKPPLPSPPKKPDMNQYNHYHRAAVGNTLYRHFAHRPDVLVSGEGYLCFERSRIRSGWLEPDLVVAFGVNPDEISENNGYEIDDVGKPPEFVMEVASLHTGRRDYTVKRAGYARYGVGEYWRFDYTGGRYHDAPLAGDLLVDGRYESIPLADDRPGAMFGMLSGYSPALDLYICWDSGSLRFYDPKAEAFLRDPRELETALAVAQIERATVRAERDEARAERNAAQAQQESLQAERDEAQAERDAAQAQRESLQAERDAAQAELDAANARIQQLRAKLGL